MRSGGGVIGWTAGLAVAVLAIAAVPSAAIGPDATVLLSPPGAAPNSGQANSSSIAQSGGRSTSADGRYVAFASSSDGLSPDDNDRYINAFVLDSQTGTTALVSRAADGTAAAGNSGPPTISADGKVVAFQSDAPNLVPGDTNAKSDVFVKNLTTGVVTLASRATGAGGALGTDISFEPVISSNGNVVAFESLAILDPQASNTISVYARNLTTNTTTLVSRPNGAFPWSTPTLGQDVSINSDGSVIAFDTFYDLDAADTNATNDVYVRVNGTSTELVSRLNGAGTVAGNGASGNPAVSDSGARIAFGSSATNFGPADGNAASDVYVRDRGTNTTTQFSRVNGSAVVGNHSSLFPSISADGATVAFISFATNLGDGLSDGKNSQAFSRSGTTTTLLSRADGPAGAIADAGVASVSLVPDASGLAMSGNPTNLSTDDDDDFTSVFLRKGTATSLVSRGPAAGPFMGGVNHAFLGSQRTVSADGRYVVFSSGSDTLSAADDNRFTNIFVADTLTGTLSLVSRAADGTAANESSSTPTISADGTRVAFASAATNLSPDAPGGGAYALFVRDIPAGTVSLASRADGAAGAGATAAAQGAMISADGKRVVFLTSAALSPNDATTQDAYVRDLAAGTTTLVSRADGSSGAGANGVTFNTSIDATGNRVAFDTQATNLGDGDADLQLDAHVRDIGAGRTLLADLADGSTTTKAPSSSTSQISADGNHVAFESSATNLGDGDSDAIQDVHVRDLAANTTVLVSRADGAGGAKSGSSSNVEGISDDGHRVTFTSADPVLAGGTASGLSFVYQRDVSAATTRVVSRADGAGGGLPDLSASGGAMNADGSCVAFTSNAGNLVANGYATRDFSQLYMRSLGAECPPVAPDTTITSGPPAASTDTTPTFAFSASEATQRFECQVDSAAFATCVAPFTSEPLAVGAHTFAVRAVDLVGLVDPTPATSTFTIAAVTPAAPVISGFRVTHKKFRVGKKPTATTARRKKPKPPPTGTTFVFKLSKAAKVTITLDRPAKGIRKGKRCVARPHKLPAHAKKCTRHLPAGALVRKKAKKGSNRVAFSGKVGKRKLRPATYRATIGATASGRSAKRRTLTFAVVR